MKRLLSFLVWLVALAFLPVVSVRATSPQTLLPRSERRRPLLGWLESQALWFFALLLTLGGVAFAQDSIPGLPPEFQPYVPVVIGLAASLIVSALTAIAKRFGRTSGVSTVVVSGVLSALAAGIGGYLTGVYGHGPDAFWAAFWATVVAFLRANGAYLSKKQAAAGALPTVVVTSAAPQLQVPVGTPGSEVLHQLDGSISAVLPLTPGQPTQVKTGLEPLK